MKVHLAIILLVVSSLTSLADAANPTRFVARFANGNFVESNNLSDWHVPDGVPKLETLPLFDANNPVRWLIDRSLPPSQPLPDAFVEMTTGDRLPGIVTEFRTGTESPYAPTPAHFVVRCYGPNIATLETQLSYIRVDANYVRRIVLSRRRTESWQPRTAFLRDGSFLRFRSIRWSNDAVSLLLESGPRRLGLNELAEVHLAPREFWPVYFDELAVVSPDGQRRLLQSDATSGFIVTTSLDRLIPRFVGDSKDVGRWLLGMQPAWSLDVIWLLQGTVRARRSFAPHEVLLSRVPPVRAEQRPSIGSAKFPFATNQNLESGPLRSQTRESGWGFGVHAFSELEFELPASARSLRSEFAMDARMKTGGCVQPRVLNASAGNAVLYQGPVVTGSESVLDTGAVGISGQGDSPRRLVLQVDPVLANRPENADPLNIRDQANWLDPTVELDPAAVKQQIDSRLGPQNLAWQGWDLQVEAGGQVQRTNFFTESPSSGEFRSAIGVTAAPLKLSKNLELTPGMQWLVVDAVRTQPPGPPCKLSVKLGNEMPIEWDIPVYDKNRFDLRPWVLPLSEFHKKKSSNVQIELRQLPTPDRVPVLWRSIAVTEQHPLFYRLLEDSTDPASGRAGNASAPTVGESDTQMKFTGANSWRLPVPSELTLPINPLLAIRERPQLGEYRFVRFAVRKQGGGSMQMAINHAGTAERPANYFAGKGPPEDPSTKRLNNQEFPKEWQFFTRDLYGDFGNLDVTGLSFQFPDGEQVWLDHVYFARTQSDFDLIKATLDVKK